MPEAPQSAHKSWDERKEICQRERFSIEGGGVRMTDRTMNLPVFGIGPLYVLSCLLLTIGALALKHYGLLTAGEVTRGKTIMLVGGALLIGIGGLLWIHSVLFQRIGEEIRAGHLVTTGVYSIVRNPIYSSFTFVFTGIILTAGNLYLLVLPFIFWGYLTILLKLTEEKWLRKKFEDEYIRYCRRVNRVIPWFGKGQD